MEFRKYHQISPTNNHERKVILDEEDSHHIQLQRSRPGSLCAQISASPEFLTSSQIFSWTDPQSLLNSEFGLARMPGPGIEPGAFGFPSFNPYESDALPTKPPRLQTLLPLLRPALSLFSLLSRSVWWVRKSPNS